jgi:hypothetical protein
LYQSVISAQAEEEVQNIHLSFRLQEILRIDTGSKGLAEKGLFDIHRFDVDTEDNIYVLNPKNLVAMIFVLDRSGKIVRSFEKKG